MDFKDSLKIRLAKTSDCQAIFDIHVESAKKLCIYYSPSIIEGWFNGRTPEGYKKGIDKKEIYVCEHNGKIKGFSHIVPGEIFGLFVDPDFARTGIGTALLKHGLEIAKKGWTDPIKLESTLNAVPFYEKYGFRKIKETVCKRNNTVIPIVLMEL